jgi:hypothetical protein
VANKEDRTARASRSRLDLAGMLFRPHWPAFRAAKRLPADSGARRRSRAWTGRIDSAQAALDVICCGMYRACSTWQYEVVAHLVEQYKGGQRLGYLSGERYRTLTRPAAATVRNATSVDASWRVVKSHDRDRSFSRALADGQALAVYAYRDVRDVVFSLMHKRGMTFEQLLRQGMIHQIIANDRFWMAQPNLLVQRYEDLLIDPTAGVMELAHHLEIRLDERDAARIAGEYSQESNKARTDALKQKLERAGVDLHNADNAQICDATTLLHWNHIRPESSRSWRALATRPQRRLLHRLCGRWLAARGYPTTDDELGDVKVSLRERTRSELDLIAARANHLARSSSQRFPKAVRVVKRTLGMPVEAHVGATAWADGAAAESRALSPASAASFPPLRRGQGG